MTDPSGNIDNSFNLKTELDGMKTETNNGLEINRKHSIANGALIQGLHAKQVELDNRLKVFENLRTVTINACTVWGNLASSQNQKAWCTIMNASGCRYAGYKDPKICE